MKERRIILHKAELLKEFDSLTYKFAETSVSDTAVQDSVASDSETHLDGTVITRLMDLRYKILKKRISFCVVELEREVVDDTLFLAPTYEFNLELDDKFNDNNLDTAVTFMHEYVVKGALLDWYNRIGATAGVTGLEDTVASLEKEIANLFRQPGFVRHPGICYISSYRTR